MHILYVNADRGIPIFGNKGASVHIRELVNAFAEQGHSVSLVTSRCAPQTEPLNARVIKVHDSSIDVEIPNQAEKAQRRDLQAIQNSQKIALAIPEIHRSQPIDFIYERYSLFSTAGLEAARTLKIPLVLEVNSPLVEEQLRYRSLARNVDAQETEKMLFNNADLILPVSDQVADYVISRGAAKERVLVVPNAVNTTVFHPEVPADQEFIDAQRFTIGFVGSLKQWHGIDLLLRAFLALVNQDIDARLLIIGDGPMRGWLDGFAAGANLEDRIDTTAWVPHRRLPGLLRSMDVAVAPYPASENFYFSPLKLYEYLAAGLPTIASDTGQINQIISHHQNGLLISAGHEAALVDALLELYRNSKLRSRLGRQAHRSMAGRSWQDNAREICTQVQGLRLAERERGELAHG